MHRDQDSKLVQECLAGHPRAFEQIVERYKKPLFNVAFRITSNYDEAEDITQSVFIKAYENLSAFNVQRKLFSWLYRIAINESLNVKNARKQNEDAGVSVLSREKGPDEQLHDKQQCQTVQVALKKLSDDYRIVVILRHFQDLSYSEIAEILQLQEKTVKSRLFSARQQLRQLLIKSEIL